MGAWGYALFQSDHDFDLVSDLDHEAGLRDLEKQDAEAARAAGKKAFTWSDDDENDDGVVKDPKDKDGGEEIHYSIYAPQCSDVERVRTFLDGGKLDEMFAEKEKEIEKGEKGFNQGYFGPTYTFVLLGACAMTLGCKLRPRIRQLLKKRFPNVELPPEADEQMEAALINPEALANPPEKIYKSGDPYDFESPGLIETANTNHDDKSRKPNALGFYGMNVPVGGIFKNPPRTIPRMTEDVVAVSVGAFGRDRCAGCGVIGTSASPLLKCASCKASKYCDKQCQKEHWKLHKDGCKKFSAGTAALERGEVVQTLTEDGKVINMMQSHGGKVMHMF